MKKILPILLALFGLVAGGVGGYLLRPAPEAAAASKPLGNEAADHVVEPDHGTRPGQAALEYVKLNNQFVVPIVTGGDVSGLVILSMSLEVSAGASENVFSREPRLRDSFLQVLFDHANAGGFKGVFTQSNNLDVLRAALLEVARKSLGDVVHEVLITDIVRQDS